MPELPEVEAARRRADRYLRGRRIRRVAAVVDPVMMPGLGPGRLAAALRGRRVLGLGRRGKHMWIELDRRPWPTIHFGMTGEFGALRPGDPLPRAWRLDIEVEGGRRLVLSDPRRFGRVRLLHDPLGEPPISELGPDPLDGLPPARALWQRLQGRGAPIKPVLLDQSLFAGVGNWIADEVLYQAGLSPHRPARSLSLPEAARMRQALLRVVRTAVRVDADSDRFPRHWLFHHRWGRRAQAMTARRESIVHETIGGRTAAWVPARQR